MNFFGVANDMEMDRFSGEIVIVVLMLVGVLFIVFSKPFARVSTKNAEKYYKIMSREQSVRWWYWHRFGAVAIGSFFTIVGILYFSGVLH